MPFLNHKDRCQRGGDQVAKGPHAVLEAGVWSFLPLQLLGSEVHLYRAGLELGLIIGITDNAIVWGKFRCLCERKGRQTELLFKVDDVLKTGSFQNLFPECNFWITTGMNLLQGQMAVVTGILVSNFSIYLSLQQMFANCCFIPWTFRVYVPQWAILVNNERIYICSSILTKLWDSVLTRKLSGKKLFTY